MIKCEKYRQNMILFFYQELESNKIRQMQTHINRCRECSARFYELKGSELLCYEPEDVRIPGINWNQLWDKISQDLTDLMPEPKTMTVGRIPRFMIGPAVICLIFVIGIFVGKYFLPSPSPLSGFKLAKNNIYLTIKEHFDNIKPVLIEYSNYPEFTKRKNNLRLDRSMASNLLVQNHLLQQQLGQDQDKLLIQLLEELEIVLTDLSNLSEREYRNLKIINDFIKIKGILLKLEVFHLQAKKGGGGWQNEIF